MKDSANRVIFAFYGLFGAGLGLLIFVFALDGWSFAFTGHASKPWNGAIALIICCLLGGFATGSLSTKNDMVHGTITGIISSTLLASINDFDFNIYSLVNYIVAILATLFGTSLAMKLKKKKTLQNMNT